MRPAAVTARMAAVTARMAAVTARMAAATAAVTARMRMECKSAGTATWREITKLVREVGGPSLTDCGPSRGRGGHVGPRRATWAEKVNFPFWPEKIQSGTGQSQPPR